MPPTQLAPEVCLVDADFSAFLASALLHEENSVSSPFSSPLSSLPSTPENSPPSSPRMSPVAISSSKVLDAPLVNSSDASVTAPPFKPFARPQCSVSESAAKKKRRPKTPAQKEHNKVAQRERRDRARAEKKARGPQFKDAFKSSISPRIEEKFRNAEAIECEADVRKFPAAKGAYIGLRSPSAAQADALADLLSQGFRLVEWSTSGP